MATVQLADVVKELNVHLADNKRLIPGAINSPEIEIFKYAKTISKIKGQYPSAHSLITNVVQGFGSSWNELGGISIAHKKLEAFHQKVNFALVPADIRNSYFGELYAEGKSPQEMPFSKYVFDNELLPKVTSDVADLSVNGTYDSNNLGVYGNSMNGIIAVINAILANTDHPAFKIPLNGLTDNNILDEVTKFERALPRHARRKIKAVFMSEYNKERYQLAYEERFGDNKFLNDQMKTRLLKLPIVGLKDYDGDLIWATTEGNMVRLIDDIDNPASITDIQKLDYQVKIFMEFTLGLDFLINQQVFVSNYADGTLGLGSAELNQKYYNFDGVTV